MTGGRTRPDSRLNLRDGGRRDRPQPSLFLGSQYQTITQPSGGPAHRSGACALNWQSVLPPSHSGKLRRICDAQLRLHGCSARLGPLQQCPCFGSFWRTMAAGKASHAGSGSKGSEAMCLVFSRVDAGSGNRRGSGGRPNGPCKAMCFLPCSIIPGGLWPVTAPSQGACRSFPDGCACRATRKGESDASTDPTA